MLAARKDLGGVNGMHARAPFSFLLLENQFFGRTVAGIGRGILPTKKKKSQWCPNVHRQ
jgi:hypothetical protein